jgi:hypothetical protein
MNHTMINEIENKQIVTSNEASNILLDFCLISSFCGKVGTTFLSSKV